MGRGTNAVPMACQGGAEGHLSVHLHPEVQAVEVVGCCHALSHALDDVVSQQVELRGKAEGLGNLPHQGLHRSRLEHEQRARQVQHNWRVLVPAARGMVDHEVGCCSSHHTGFRLQSQTPNFHLQTPNFPAAPGMAPPGLRFSRP